MPSDGTVIREMHVNTPFGGLDELWQALLKNRTALTLERVPRPQHWQRFFGDGATAASLVLQLETWEAWVEQQGARLRVFMATTKSFIDNDQPARPVWNHDFNDDAPTIISNACVSGAQAVIEAVDAIDDGDCDAAGVVGGDVITDFIVAGFDALQARSPNGARPFDRARNGLSLGEAGCDLLLLPPTDDPRAKAYPHVIAYGCGNDANHISGPSRDGSGLALAIERALRGIDKSAIRAICAHGTGTPYNDAMEARAFHTAFDGVPPPVFGIKGAIGHTLGAAGLIEVIVSAKVAAEGVIPPTVGFEEGEDDFPLDIVHGEPRTVEPGYVLTTNSGFGGMNTAIVVGPGDA